MIFELQDELGRHMLNTETDCVFKCPECEKEVEMTKENMIGQICECGEEMQIRYWFDFVYPEDYYEELLKENPNARRKNKQNSNFIDKKGK